RLAYLAARPARGPAVGMVPAERVERKPALREAARHARTLHVVRDGCEELVERDRVHLAEGKREEVPQVATVREGPREQRALSRRRVEQAKRNPERQREGAREAAHQRQ